MSWYAGFEPIIETDAALADHTWYRLGGPARWLCRPRDETELSAIFARVREADLPWRVLGAGANVLVRDEGYDGVVFKLEGPEWQRMRFEEEQVHAKAGAELQKLIRETLRHGLVGLEVLAGIPSTLGGAVRMNAGGRYGEIATFVEDVRVLEQDGSIGTRGRAAMDFGYRRCDLRGGIVLGATLALHAPGPKAVAVAKSRYKEIWQIKHSEQPAVAERSSGCIFKNPEQAPAGRLLDDVGLKGARVGGARISERHANFIVAEADARAADVLALIEQARTRVHEHTGIELEPEVDIW